MDKNFKLKSGDIVIYKKESGDIRRLIVSYYDYYDDDYDDYNGCTISQFEHNSSEVLEVKRPTVYKTSYKKKEILDSTEKKYLSDVIRPFRNTIEYIGKYNFIGPDGKKYEYIRICSDKNSTPLPLFEISKMYKGMKLEKKYTLEELGL